MTAQAAFALVNETLDPCFRGGGRPPFTCDLPGARILRAPARGCKRDLAEAAATAALSVVS